MQSERAMAAWGVLRMGGGSARQRDPVAAAPVHGSSKERMPRPFCCCEMRSWAVSAEHVDHDHTVVVARVAAVRHCDARAARGKGTKQGNETSSNGHHLDGPHLIIVFDVAAVSADVGRWPAAPAAREAAHVDGACQGDARSSRVRALVECDPEPSWDLDGRGICGVLRTKGGRAAARSAGPCMHALRACMPGWPTPNTHRRSAALRTVPMLKMPTDKLMVQPVYPQCW